MCKIIKNKELNIKNKIFKLNFVLQNIMDLFGNYFQNSFLFPKTKKQNKKKTLFASHKLFFCFMFLRT